MAVGPGGFYADILLDPLNGESKHGASLTSAFTFSGKAAAGVAARSRKSPRKRMSKRCAKQPTVSVVGGVRENDPARVCRAMANGLQAMLATDALDDAAALRAAQDYVRKWWLYASWVISTGLRTGTTSSATLTSKELDDWFNYLSGKPLDSYTRATTSVMNTRFSGAVFTGWLMRTIKCPTITPQLLGLFRQSGSPHTNKMLFATDEDVGIYGDVKRFDYGRECIGPARTRISQNHRSAART